jgi:hypothetical protein
MMTISLHAPVLSVPLPELLPRRGLPPALDGHRAARAPV